MVQFFHPSTKDITLTGVLAALGDPARLNIVRALVLSPEGKNCGEAAPCLQLPRSTLSNHFRILREAGIIHAHKKGVEIINVVRLNDLETRFPGLLSSVLSYPEAA